MSRPPHNPDEITAEAAAAKVREGARLVDVREKSERDSAWIAGSVHLPLSELDRRLAELGSAAGVPTIFHCAGGGRALAALQKWKARGGTGVSLKGGINAWAAAGLPVETKSLLDDADRRRYARHVAVPEIGEEGQRRLLGSRVVLVGAGGLGCPAALYLAAAGVGTLGIVDFDKVEESNLQRQILHTPSRLGWPKIESARLALSEFSPRTKVIAHGEKLDAANAETLFNGYDLVVDGSDNFTARYVVNDACAKLGIAFVHASVQRFEGQLAVFDPATGACYRCLFPEPPPPALAPSCAEAGVLGVLPGVLGVLQATEAIKKLLGIGRSVEDRLLVYDALAGSFREFALSRDPACPHH